LPGVLTGSAALITAVVGALALFSNDRPPAAPSAQSSVESQSPAGGEAAPGTPAGAGGSGAAGDAACWASYLADIPAERRKSLGTGAAELVLIGATEPKSGVVAVRLSEGDRPLGVLKLRVRTADETFHIEGVVDSACRVVTDVANASRGGDPRVLLNWDDARFRIGGNAYLLRLGYSGGEVSVGYFRRVVE
jgi:hypothetical protein